MKKRVFSLALRKLGIVPSRLVPVAKHPRATQLRAGQQDGDKRSKVTYKFTLQREREHDNPIQTIDVGAKG